MVEDPSRRPIRAESRKLMVLKDPTALLWRFTIADQPQPVPKWMDFAGMIATAKRWCGASGEAATAPKKPEPRHHHGSYEIDRVDWSKSPDDDTFRSMNAYSLLDAYVLRTGVYLEARTGEPYATQPQDIWRAFRLYQQENEEGYFFAATVCLTSETETQIDDAEARHAARVMLRGWLNRDPGFIEVFAVGFGYIARHDSASNEIWVALCRKDAKSCAQRDRFLNRTLPPLILASSKVRIIEQDYDGTEERDCLYAKARRLQATLEEKLDQFQLEPNTLSVVEAYAYEIACVQSDFNKALSQCCKARDAIGVNVANVERLLDAALFSRSKNALDQAIVDPMRLAQERINANLGFFVISRDRANDDLQTMQVIRDSRGNRLQRVMNLLLGLFTAMALPQVFPDPPIEGLPIAAWKLILILLGGCAVALLSFFLSRDTSLHQRRLETIRRRNGD